jgi:Tfp pilus assembly protein PilO
MFAMGWFFFISPQYDDRANLRSERAAAQERAVKLEQRLEELKAQNAELPRYLAELERGRQALPTASGMSDFVREMKTAGELTGTNVTSIVVGAAEDAPAGGGSVQSLPVSLTVTGSIDALNGFLDRLQLEQPRAVLAPTE